MTVGWEPKKIIGNKTIKHAWMRADSGPETDLFLDTDLCLYQGRNVKAAERNENECLWSIVPNSTGGNGNFCLLDGERDTDSTFPFTACCVRGPATLPSRLPKSSLLQRNRKTGQPGSSKVRFFPENGPHKLGPGAATDSVIEFASDEPHG